MGIKSPKSIIFMMLPGARTMNHGTSSGGEQPPLACGAPFPRCSVHTAPGDSRTHTTSRGPRNLDAEGSGVQARERAYAACEERIRCSRATGNRALNPDKPVKRYPVPAARCAPPLPSRGGTRVATPTTPPPTPRSRGRACMMHNIISRRLPAPYVTRC